MREEQCRFLGSSTLKEGAVGYVNDRIGLHAIGEMHLPAPLPQQDSTKVIDSFFTLAGNPASETVAVSLHLYSPPIRSCKVFDEAGNAAGERTLSFDTVFGRRE